jgi:hypothetical protein
LAPDIVPSLLIVVIGPSLQRLVPGMSADYDPVVAIPCRVPFAHCCPTLFQTRQDC